MQTALWFKGVSFVGVGSPLRYLERGSAFWAAVPATDATMCFLFVVPNKQQSVFSRLRC